MTSANSRKNLHEGKSLEELEAMLYDSSKVQITGLELLNDEEGSWSSDEDDERFSYHSVSSSYDSYANDSYGAAECRLLIQRKSYNPPRRQRDERLALHMDTHEILQTRDRNQRFESLGAQRPRRGFGRRSSVGTGNFHEMPAPRSIPRRASMGARIPDVIKDINDSGSGVIGIPGGASVWNNNGVGRAA